MNKSTISLAALALALVAAGCGKSSTGEYKPVPPKEPETANVKAGEESSLFPSAVGNRWAYDAVVVSAGPSGAIRTPSTITLEIKEVNPGAEGIVKSTVEISKGEVLQDRQIWVVNREGIFLEQTGIDTISRPDPMQLTVPFPIELDKIVEWKGKAQGATGKVAEITQEVVHGGPEDVDTIVGMLSAYRVETTQRFKVDKADVLVTNTSWWAPKIGLVRYKQEVKGNGRVVQSQTMMLKQYTVK